MVCRQFGAKPLPEPMLAYCQFGSLEQISVKVKSVSIAFIKESKYKVVVRTNGGHFVRKGEGGCAQMYKATIATDKSISACYLVAYIRSTNLARTPR